MPHKHKRRQNDADIYDLPPTLIAKSLPVRDPHSKPSRKKKGKDAKKPTQPARKPEFHRKSTAEDDTPKSFRRLMQLQSQATSMSSKPDAGQSKKRKRGNAEESDSTGRKQKQKLKQKQTATESPKDNAPSETTLSMPKILPGEKLSDFAARVDRELPLNAIKKSSRPASSDIPGSEEKRQTKHEKHLRRLQRQWREDDVAIREREAAEREEREAEMEDELRLWKEWEQEAGKGKAKKKNAPSKRKKKSSDQDGGDSGDDNPDPWAKLAKRDRMRKANPFEVAEAPPQLTKPREIFRVRGGAKVDVANVPAAAGSLRTREELAAERRNIVDQYRKLMAEKRQ
ncbi:hypothetical protein EYZ11_006732 [Aspergillus tanneri]|uniref:Urease accessory protein UreD n=1 Tax=Aspergillus tanneri TaxID=1220188 RepID=A0A4S3JEP7_9EURO|nr:uncharacterized protein ATNIH1004_004121 [Aspergillus tanneri]KAA8648238.1 hypothetical protein ATNIH1004_004121 [Aspergillus tanneri]THC93786.1 hypothetical protein EYZ11_006732 [Aspergillus tanneri]